MTSNTNLNNLNQGMNEFCGPAVLSILTGRSIDECAIVIGSIRGNYKVKGVLLNDLLMALDKLGYDQIPTPHGNTLFSTLTMLANEDGIYIVSLRKHYVIIEVLDRKIYFCDNHTKEPINAASSARLGDEVRYIHKIVKRPLKIEVSIQLEVVRTHWTVTIQKRIRFNYGDDVVIHNGSFQASNNELKEITEKLIELSNDN